MNNDQFDCPKCSRNFRNKTHFQQHTRLCDQKDPLALDDEEKDPSDVVIEIEDDPVKTEKVLDPKYSIQVGNSPPVRTGPAIRGGVRRVRGGAVGSNCVYCGHTLRDRISLAKHLVGQHWQAVREKQGGGRRNNYSYYSNIQDDRVIKPARLSPHITPRGSLTRHSNPSINGTQNRKIMPKVTGGSFERKILPKPLEVRVNNRRNPPWTAAIRDEDFRALTRKGTNRLTITSDGSMMKVGPSKVRSTVGQSWNRKVLPMSMQVRERLPGFQAIDRKLTGRGTAPLPNTNHCSLKKVVPTLEKLVKKFANSNSNLKITKVSKETSS